MRRRKKGAGDASLAPAALLGSQAGRNDRHSNPLAAGGGQLSHPVPKLGEGMEGTLRVRRRTGGRRGTEEGW